MSKATATTTPTGPTSNPISTDQRTICQGFRFDWIKSQLGECIEFFEKEARKHRHMHRRLCTGTAILTACAALVSAAAAAEVFRESNAWLNLASVAASTLSGLVAGYTSLRKPFELWLHEKVTSNALRDLDRQVAYTCCCGRDGAHADMMTLSPEAAFEKLQRILADSGEQWARFAQKDNQPKDGSPASRV